MVQSRIDPHRNSSADCLWFQGYWLLQTVRTARQTAHAIEAVERPYFVLEAVSGLQVRRGQIHRHYVEYRVANIGRTPALLDSLCMNFYYGKVPPESPKNYEFPDPPLLRNVPYGSGRTNESEFAIYVRGLNFFHDFGGVAPVLDIDKQLYLLARAKYQDVSARCHETGACRIYSIRTRTFEKYGGVEYNYNT